MFLYLGWRSVRHGFVTLADLLFYRVSRRMITRSPPILIPFAHEAVQYGWATGESVSGYLESPRHVSIVQPIPPPFVILLVLRVARCLLSTAHIARITSSFPRHFTPIRRSLEHNSWRAVDKRYPFLVHGLVNYFSLTPVLSDDRVIVYYI